MDKVNEETGDWMQPEVCTPDGNRVIGIVYRARTDASEPLTAIGICSFEFETNTYTVFPLAVENQPAVQLAPNGIHAVVGDKTQIQVLNMETGEVTQILKVRSESGQFSTITKDGYLYYSSTRDERDIWLSEMGAIPVQPESKSTAN